MTPARWFRPPSEERLLVVDPEGGSLTDACVADLGAFLAEGDLLVVNDAATIPASIHGRTGGGDPIEVRLLRDGTGSDTFGAVLFGHGDWTTRTEDRPPPPRLAPGDGLSLGGTLRATVVAVDAASPRLVRLAFERSGAALWEALYAHGRPVQYAHVARPFATWHVQTSYGARPWASEPPSAGRPLTWRLLLSLRRKGVSIASVTHAAGLSATGDPGLDAALPLPECYEIPEETCDAVRRVHARGRRVVAVGTSVVRALEASAGAHGGAVTAGRRTASLRIDAGHRLLACDGLLTGIHDPGTSHAMLLGAFAPQALLTRAQAHAEAAGYLGHELGDSCLVLARSPR